MKNDTFPLEMINIQLEVKLVFLSLLIYSGLVIFKEPIAYLSVNMLRFDFCPTCRQTGGNASQLHRPLQIPKLSVSLKMIPGNSCQNKQGTQQKEQLCYALGPIRDRPCWRGSVCKCPSAGGFGTPGLRCGPGASSSG